MSHVQQTTQWSDPTGNDPEQTGKKVPLTTLSHFGRISDGHRYLVQTSEGSFYSAIGDTEKEG